MKETQADIDRLMERLGVEIGSGMTKRKVLMPETEEDHAEIRRVLGKGTLPERIDRIEAEAWKALHASARFREIAAVAVRMIREGKTNLPPDVWLDEQDPNFDDPAWPQNNPRTATILLALIKKLGFKPYADDEWYAAKVANIAHRLRACLYVEGGGYASETAKHEHLAELALRLAALRTEWRMKRHIPRYVAAGKSKKTAPMKSKAIEIATHIWTRPGEVMRIGEVVGIICDTLHLKYKKKKYTVKRWLKQAEKEGLLTIPEEASRPGAQRKDQA